MTSAESTFVLAFDIGGSHVTAGLCRLSDLHILHESSASLAGPNARIDTFDAFADLLYRLGSQASAGAVNVTGAALAVPFPFDTDAGVSLMEHKLKPLYGKDLRGALAHRFGWAWDQFLFLNDACAYLLGEVGDGSLKGARRAAGLTLGTGVGSAFAIDGHCQSDGIGVPPGGEIWNLPYAGGIVEDLISTRAIKAEYLARTGLERDVAEIAADAATEDDAREVFEEFGVHLGEVLRDVIAPFHPDMVVIGGGISRSAPLFLPTAEQQIHGLGFCVVQSTLQDQAPLVGAAHYWREEKADTSIPQASVAVPRKL
jgi:glucokinase